MSTQGDIIYTRHTFTQIAEEHFVFVWQGITDGIGHINSCCSSLNGCSEHLTQIIPITACCIFSRELDSWTETTCIGHHSLDTSQSLFTVDTEFMCKVNVRGRKKHMDDRLFSFTHSFPSCINITGSCTGQTCNGDTMRMMCDLFDGCEITRRSRRKTGLDDIYMESD